MPPLPSPESIPGFLSITEGKPTEATLIAEHVPTPGTVLMLQAQGRGVAAIAEEIGQSVDTTRKILSEARRRAMVAAGRDIIARDLIPRVIDGMERALAADSSDTDIKRGDFALKLADRIGLTDLAINFADNGTEKVETLEEWRVRRRVTHEQSAPLHPEYRVVDAPSQRSLQAGEPPDHAGSDDDSGGTDRE